MGSLLQLFYFFGFAVSVSLQQMMMPANPLMNDLSRMRIPPQHPLAGLRPTGGIMTPYYQNGLQSEQSESIMGDATTDPNEDDDEHIYQSITELKSMNEELETKQEELQNRITSFRQQLAYLQKMIIADQEELNKCQAVEKAQQAERLRLEQFLWRRREIARQEKLYINRMSQRRGMNEQKPIPVTFGVNEPTKVKPNVDLNINKWESNWKPQNEPIYNDDAQTQDDIITKPVVEKLTPAANNKTNSTQDAHTHQKVNETKLIANETEIHTHSNTVELNTQPINNSKNTEMTVDKNEDNKTLTSTTDHSLDKDKETKEESVKNVDGPKNEQIDSTPEKKSETTVEHVVNPLDTLDDDKPTIIR